MHDTSDARPTDTFPSDSFPRQNTVPGTEAVEIVGESPRERFARILGEYVASIENISTPDDVDLHAFGVMEQLPDAVENARIIADSRLTGFEDKETIARQASLFGEVKAEIALVSGVELDEDRVQRENIEYRTKASELIGDDEVDDEQLLLTLGILREDPDGETRFQFPDEVFPPHIEEKWTQYLSIVKRHLAVVGKRTMGIENDPALIAQLDSVRSHAHNTVASAMNDFLMIKEWDFEAYRKFVAKMRDSAIPNIETAEQEVTAKGVRMLLAHVQQRNT